jgi:hypothetical protein
MRRSVLIVLLTSFAMSCTPALAATVRVDYQRDALIYRAAPGERNRLSVTASRNSTSQGDEYITFTVADSVAIKPGEGCGRPGLERGFVECELWADPRAIVRLGDRRDRARVLSWVVNFLDDVMIDGGRGDDLLVGGPERDTLLGGPGTDDLRGGGGVDRVLAGSYGPSQDVTADRLRGGRGSDLLMGSAGPNLIVPGPGVDKVSAGRGRDLVQARDGAIEQVHCGAGEDTAVTDGIDYPLACEHHEPYSKASPVPLDFYTGTAGGPSVSALLGCREAHPAACAGTVQLELDGRALSDEQSFTFANRHRFVVAIALHEPLAAFSDALVVRIRARGADGAPTDDRYPVATMLVDDPFLRPF